MLPAINVLLADDSALMRREIRKILSSDPGIHVVATARNGRDAVELVRQHEPDVVTMDINMPEMDGITALQIIMMESPRPVVMLSSLTQEGALTTFECLELGAVDFVPKPSGTISRDIHTQRAEIVAKVKSAARCRTRRPGQMDATSRGPRPVPGKGLSPGGASAPPRLGTAAASGDAGAPAATDVRATRVVAIGISTGGPKTLMEVVPLLPANLDAAVVIVQHMPEAFTGPFAQRMDAASAMPVKEAAAGDILLKGHAYLARGGKHMVFAKASQSRGPAVRRVSHPQDEPHIPSVNVMMQSALATFGPRNVVAVLMTGMGADGADAMVSIRQAGGMTIAEHEETCVVYGMPGQAVARGGAEFVVPAYGIAEKIVELVGTC